MSDDRVKLCPHCSEVNERAAYHCKQCGNSLIEVLPIPRALAVTAASALDESRESDITDAEEATTPQQSLCPHPDCGKPNRPYKLICEHCGRRLDNSPEASESDTVAQAGADNAELKSTETGPRLLLVVGARSFECRNGDILGRQGTIASEVFLGIDTVSRQHVLLTFQNGQWSLTVLSDKLTLLDGQNLRKGSAIRLDAGEHSLGLSSRCEVWLKLAQSPTGV